jgi:hypothetical protein
MNGDKSFFTFLKVVYSNSFGKLIGITVPWIGSILYLSYLYSPSDFGHPATFNAWWIVLFGMIAWVHVIAYVVWHDEKSEDEISNRKSEEKGS